MPIKLFLLFLFIACHSQSVFADLKTTANVENGWVVARQGVDENSQKIKVKIWGSTNIKSNFYQLNKTVPLEYVVISRSSGSGPYYKLQIIEFRQKSIITSSYDSFGIPKITNNVVYLGLPKKYEGAAFKPEYQQYYLSANGLVELDFHRHNN